MRCTVIGAGVSGLTTAVELARAGHRVDMVCEALPEQTTTAVAAAFWYPYRAFPHERVLQWAKTAYGAFADLCADPATGVSMRTAIEAVASTRDKPWWAAAVNSLRRAEPDQLPPGAPAAWTFRAPVIDTRRYLPWLLVQGRDLGVSLTRRRVEHFDELPPCDAIINCSGLGARELASDQALTPIRGQLVHVDAPGIEHVFLDERRPQIAYVVPRDGDVVLGGSAEENCEDLTIRPAETEAILAACTALAPKLGGASVKAVVVGVRPGRHAIRLESTDEGGRRVVHNYGHGGAGITLSWGCAREVVGLLS